MSTITNIERQINIQDGDYNDNRVISHIIVNSIDYQRLCDDIAELQEDIKNAATDEIKLKKSGKLSEKQQQLDELKENVYRLYETFNKIPLNTERLKQAKACFDEGKFREADILLNAEEMDLELELLNEAESKKEEELSRIREKKIDKSNEYLIKALSWTTFYNEPNRYEKVIEYFEKALNAFPTIEALFEYAYFLQHHNQFSEASLLYQIALSIFQNLAEENLKAYLPNIADTLNNLAILHANINDYPKAEKEYNEALEIYRQLAQENPKAYLLYVAGTLNNLAILHANINDYPKAEKEYNEALEIQRQLAKKNPKAYLPNVAAILNNLAIFHLYSVPNKKLSLKYTNEAIEVLGNCNDTPFVREEFEKTKQIIQKWQQ